MEGLHAEEGLLGRLCFMHGPVGGLLEGPLHEPVCLGLQHRQKHFPLFRQWVETACVWLVKLSTCRHHQRQGACVHALREGQLPTQDEGLQRSQRRWPLRSSRSNDRLHRQAAQ